MNNNSYGSQKIRSLAKSFKFAGRGILYCVKNERNMRIHFTVAAYVLVFSLFYGFSQVEMLILLLTISAVITVEALNTAIEALCNLETQSYDSLARIAKDVSAGAVLLIALFAAVIGIILFIKPAKLLCIFNFLTHNLFFGILFLVSLPISYFFISGKITGFLTKKKHI